MDKDEVLRGFRRYVPHPEPEDVAWWVRAFPRFAEAIRSHAREVIDNHVLAALAAREEDLRMPDGRGITPAER